MKKEIWKQVPEYRKYEVSTLGKVKSSNWKTKRILKKGINKRGYYFVRLSKKGQQEYFYLSRLVLETFIGPRPKGREASHLNDIKTDNRLCNLKWETPMENLLRRIIKDIKKFNLTYKEKANIKILYKQLGKFL